MTAALSDWNGAIRSAPQSTRSIESVLLPLDGTENSQSAIPVARKLSELYGATLHMTYVGEQALDVKAAAGRLGLGPQDVHGTIFESGKGDPVEVVMKLARDLPKAVIVMSTCTGHLTDANHFGSITESIFASKPERTVLVSADSGGKSWNMRRILLAHDGTPTCHAATGPAAELAQRAGAEVIALHVAARGEQRPGEPGSIPAPLYVDQPQHEWPAWAEEFMNRVVAAGAPSSSVHFKLVVTGGQPGSEVAQVARERQVDLVVMAWHGHWDHESCATRVVIRTSGCPVMLVYSAD